MHFANVGSLGVPIHDTDWSLNSPHKFEAHDLQVEVLTEDSPGYEQEIDLVPGKSVTGHDCSRGQCKRLRMCVSGQVFETQLGTLNRYPNTLLGNPAKRRRYWNPEHRSYYLDRHAPTFGSILYYYQSGGRLYRPEDIPEDVFLRELEFYELGSDVLKEYKLKNGFLPESNITLSKYAWQRSIWLFVEYPSSSSLANIAATVSLIIILLSIVNFCLETLPTFKKSACTVDNSSWVTVDGIYRPKESLNVSSPFFLVECVCAIWFTSEVILRLISTPSFKTYFKAWMNLFDIAAIMPFYIFLGVVYISGSCGDTKRSSTSIVFLRVLRLFRAFRILKLTKHSRGMQILGVTIKKSLQELYLFGLFLIITVVLFSAAIYYADMLDTGSKNIASIPDGFWLTIITMCTVGYGDVTPDGATGKLVGSVCVVSGVITIALLVPVVVSNFSSYYSHELNNRTTKRSRQKAVYSYS
ncbi:potassium voltage-gated channel subfamily A member 1-like [Watersipora subatra]|uniref:potassium voltage-gated channel subfamily A member 1-like n=1 Tax=Watersipora subatra TaxID=2589382 RepID=UPI00355B51F9